MGDLINTSNQEVKQQQLSDSQFNLIQQQHQQQQQLSTQYPQFDQNNNNDEKQAILKSPEYQKCFEKDKGFGEAYYNVASQPTQPTKNESEILKCKHCNNIVKTEVSYKGSLGTLILSGFLLVTVCILAPIPYFSKKTQNCHHKCPKCNKLIGKVQWIDGPEVEA